MTLTIIFLRQKKLMKPSTLTKHLNSQEQNTSSPKTEKDIEQTVPKHSNQSYRTEFQIGPKALIHRRFYEEATEINVERIE